MNNPSQVITDLANAIKYLDGHWWIQGDDFDGQGGCCAFGAVRGAIGDYNAYMTSPLARDRASDVARAFYGIMREDVVQFNDTPGRTKDEVLQAMRTVLQALKGEQDRA